MRCREASVAGATTPRQHQHKQEQLSSAHLFACHIHLSRHQPNKNTLIHSENTAVTAHRAYVHTNRANTSAALHQHGRAAP